MSLVGFRTVFRLLRASRKISSCHCNRGQTEQEVHPSIDDWIADERSPATKHDHRTVFMHVVGQEWD